ncbi:hypothetical protein L210DRAFT_2243074 [Boletus edulis BED1]|uniref:Secreted protein n=1 Tax=Boletus edulis BED1 TaxID=1328754 RepID=A0AAD4BSW2_BOLED|nr:hypothetical protein L210DRAFT_2243074 [Boletus edulis BED1]
MRQIKIAGKCSRWCVLLCLFHISILCKKIQKTEPPPVHVSRKCGWQHSLMKYKVREVSQQYFEADRLNSETVCATASRTHSRRVFVTTLAQRKPAMSPRTSGLALILHPPVTAGEERMYEIWHPRE